jgi:predicted N-acetyltransferase YhbS
MADYQIRPARRDEAETLTALCKRSKAHWGYDADFMRMSNDALTITPDFIIANDVLVAHADGRILGVASVTPLEEDRTFDLAHLFVDPETMTSGIGRALFAAAADRARHRGGHMLMIVSDPNAAAFYRRIGARDLGDAPSESIAGRRLPLLAYRL